MGEEGERREVRAAHPDEFAEAWKRSGARTTAVCTRSIQTRASLPCGGR